MVLEVCGDRKIANPLDSDIREALAGLNAKSGDAFAILGPDGMTYVQASGDQNIGFDLEYQEGAANRHFRAKQESLALEEVVQAFIMYRDGQMQWKDKYDFEAITW